MIKIKIKHKKEIEAFKALEEMVNVSLEPKTSKAVLVGAFLAVSGAISNWAMPNVVSSALVIGGICLLAKGIRDNGKQIDKNIYAIAFKYHRYDMYGKANHFMTLDKAKEHLKENNIDLSFDDIECYLRTIIFNNICYLKNEKTKSELIKENNKTRLEYLQKSAMVK